MLYDPVTLLRYVEQGGKATGEVFMWWPRFEDPGHRLAEARFISEPPLRNHGCRKPARSEHYAACRVQFAKEPDWVRIGHRLDSLGVWSIPGSDQIRSTLACCVYTTDQGWLRLERRTGAMYDSDWYDFGAYGEVRGFFASKSGTSLKALFTLVTKGALWFDL